MAVLISDNSSSNRHLKQRSFQRYSVSHSLPNPAERQRGASGSKQAGCLAGGPLLRVATIRRTTDTSLFISHTTNALLFKFRCNIFVGVRIIKEMPGSVASGTPCICLRRKYLLKSVPYNILRCLYDKYLNESRWLNLIRDTFPKYFIIWKENPPPN